jgi:putative membrane protein
VTSLADGNWHRLHPASPLLRGGIFVFAMLGFVIANLRERVVDVVFGIPRDSGDPLDEIYQRGAVGWALLIAAAVLIVIIVGFSLSWRMHTFRVTDESVEVRSGILFRSHRQARLDRIQGVNIVRPLIPRLFGAAKLEVSVAGQDANVQLSYLGSALAAQGHPAAGRRRPPAAPGRWRRERRRACRCRHVPRPGSRAARIRASDRWRPQARPERLRQRAGQRVPGP